MHRVVSDIAFKGKSMSVLEVINLGKVYPGDEMDLPSLEALNNINLTVDKGEFISIIGPSGCGKSTLFGIIGGLNECTSGEVLIKSEKVKGPHPSIGMVFQEIDLFPHLSVAENMAIGNLNAPSGAWVDFRRLHEWCRPFLAQVEVPVAPDAAVGSLPLGHQQLVAVARVSQDVPRQVIGPCTRCAASA